MGFDCIINTEFSRDTFSFQNYEEHSYGTWKNEKKNIVTKLLTFFIGDVFGKKGLKKGYIIFIYLSAEYRLNQN